MLRRKVIVFVGLALFALVAGFSGAALAQRTPPEEAKKFIQALGNEAFAVLGSSDTTLEAREEKVREILSRSFDIARIGRFVLGKAWKRATPEQRFEYQQVFGKFLLQTYSRRLGGYSGDAFSVVEARELGKRDAVVVTEIKQNSGPALKAGWRVGGTDGNYKILDVIVEGISMAVTQRQEFQSVVRKQGLDGLIEQLRVRVSKYGARAA